MEGGKREKGGGRIALTDLWMGREMTEWRRNGRERSKGEEREWNKYS